MDARAQLLAGGIARASATVPGVATSPLEARVYEHPALPGRKIVRLTAEAVGDATDVEMSVLGFNAPIAKERVGQSILRSLGFPAWAVVNDPKHARFALEVMQEFRRSARRIRSKPGFAKDELVAIAKRLERSVPHFLPSFWEEAGRAFVQEGSLTFAAQCFEKARSAEDSFKLTVDEDQRSRSYLEFALSGALATKSLAGYASDLTLAYGPKEGYRRFFDLAVQRTRGGVAPWSGISKDLRRLAKAAGLDLEEADRELCEAILESPSIAHAPLDFWVAYRACIVSMAKADPRVRARVRRLFPRPANHAKLIDEWLEILDESGATDAFVLGHADSAEEPHGATASWASELVLYARASGWRGPKTAAGENTFAVLAKIAPRLIHEGVPTLLQTTNGYWQSFDVDVLERALELGIALAEPKVEKVQLRAAINLTVFRLDPVRVAAHPVYGPLLVQAVAQVVGKPEFQALAVGKKGLVEARRLWLDERIAGLVSFGLPVVGTETKALEDSTSVATFAEFPESAKRLSEVRVADALRRTLHAGMLDELGWPDFERVTANLTTKKERISFFGTVSQPILRVGTKVVVFDGATEAGEHSLPVALKDLRGLMHVNGALIAHYNDASYKPVAAWSTDWKTTFPCEPGLGRIPSDLMLADASVTIGGRAISVGDQSVGEARPLASDGETTWQCVKTNWVNPVVCIEIDPKTGSKGRASWPRFAQSGTEIDDGLRMDAVTLLPLPKGADASPLGVKDGLVGWYTRRKGDYRGVESEVVRIDGVRWRGKLVPFALITFPGSTEPTAITINESYNVDRDDAITLWFDGKPSHTHGPVAEDDDLDESTLNAPIAGFKRIPRAAWLHYMRPRDERGSKALRTITAESCALLVAAAAGLDAKSGIAKITSLLETLVPELTHPLVRSGVARVAYVAHTLERRLEALVGNRDAHSGMTDNELNGMLPVPLKPHTGFYGFGVRRVAFALEKTAAFLVHGEEASIPPGPSIWLRVLPSFARALTYLATRKAMESQRASFVAMIRAYAETQFARGMTLRRAHINAESGAPILKPGNIGETWLHREGASRYVVQRRSAGADTAELDILEAFSDTPHLPKGTTLIEGDVIQTLDERAFLIDVLAELERLGPVPYAHADADALAELSLKSLAEARLLVLGMPHFNQYQANFLGKELLDQVEMKIQEAQAARLSLREIGGVELFDILGSALTGIRAADLFVCSTPSRPAPWIEAMASALARAGKDRVALRSDLLDETRRIVTYRADPTSVLTPLVDENAKTLVYEDRPLGARHQGESLSVGFLKAAADVWPHLALTLPAGDPYLKGMTLAHAKLRAALENPRTVFPLATAYLADEKGRNAIIARVGGEPVQFEYQKGESIEGVDNGVAIALRRHGTIEIAFRPATLLRKDKTPESAILDALTSELQAGQDVLSAVRFFLSDAWNRWMQRIASGVVPEGKLDADPRISAPLAIKKAKKELGLSETAAIVYLELCALPAPTDRFLNSVNGFAGDELDRAQKELLEKKLVVEGKRERAGRDVFLPGGWEKRAGYALPVETWKLPFFGGSLKATVQEPIGELYTRALDRALSDDRPRFEEVSAVRKPKGKKS